MPRHTPHCFTQQKLLALKQLLRDIQPVQYNPWSSERPLTRLEMIGLLKDEIAAMRDKGYRVAQIAEFLSDNGVGISAAGLYESMRKLGSPLRRERVPLAQRLRDCSGQADVECMLGGAAPGSVSEPGSMGGRALGRASVSPIDYQEEDAPARIVILPKAQRLFKKLKSSEAVVFKEVLSQLQHGKQSIQLNAQTNDIGQRLTVLGLLRQSEAQGAYMYQVPYEVAHVEILKRQPESDSNA